MAIRQSRVIALVNAATSYRDLAQTIKQRLESCGRLTEQQTQEFLADLYAYITSEFTRLENDYLASLVIEQHHFATKLNYNERARIKRAEQRRATNVPIRHQTHYLGETYELKPIIPTEPGAIPAAQVTNHTTAASSSLSREDQEEINEYVYRKDTAKEMYKKAVTAGGYGKGNLLVIKSNYIAEPGGPLYDHAWKESVRLFQEETDDESKEIDYSPHLEVEEFPEESE